jgi:hypothetical protein
MSVDSIIDDKITAEVAAQLPAAVALVATGPQGPVGAQGPQGSQGVAGPQGTQGPAGIGGTPEVPAWMPTNLQVGAGWPDMQARLLADEARFAKLPRSTAGKTNLTASFPSQVNHFSSALSLPENRHYLAPHTTSTGYTYIADIQTSQNAAQAPGVGAGSARTSDQIPFPDGEIMTVPYCDTAYRVMQPATETGYALSTAAPANYAFLGGAPWTDGESGLVAPHNQNYAALVNKRTGVVTQLTGYDFGGNYACAGVRRHGPTGWYAFVPHNHNKFVFLDPVTMEFHVLGFDAPGGEAYVGCTNLSTGELYYAAHKASCSVVVDPVAGTKLDTLPPTGPGYVAPTPGISNFRTCKRVADGRVVLVPFSHTKAWIYDRATNKHTQCPGTYTFGAVACASLTAWGDLMLWPWNGNAAYRLSTGYGAPIDPQIVTSPLFNGL